jgi:diguanylate cyclase (GGDEF)-like protein
MYVDRQLSDSDASDHTGPGLEPDTIPDRVALLDRILRYELLSAVFQPIFDLDDGSLLGCEGLIRGPRSTPLHTPDQLFAAADASHRRIDLEIACARVIVREFAARRLGGHLLLNMSCTALLAANDRNQRALEFIAAAGLSPAGVMVELTEHERIHDAPGLARALQPLRQAGVSLVLDDFGDGHSNLRLWMELHPRLVKIDRFFVQGLGTDGDKFEIVRLLKRFADSFGTQLVAEGIENTVDLLAARDLGIGLAQGFLLGRPEHRPSRQIPPDVLSAIRSTKLAVQPVRDNSPPRFALAGDICVHIPALAPEVTGDALAKIFAKHEQYHAVAITEAERPIGLINRHRFVDRFARPFEREVHGRKSCRVFADPNPTTVDRRTPLEAMRSLLAGEDQRYLRDGFVVTDNGKYYGVATGESLVRAVTELRIEAARYANPLTFLPGNIPISQHLDRLLAAQTSFVACYADLNHFKPFNDQYGYWRGDEVIRLAATVLQAETDSMVDFLGHVGGDDFFVVFQSEDWQARCDRAIETFNTRTRAYFSADELAANGFWGEDRKGIRCFFPLTTMSIGAVIVSAEQYQTHEDVASAAAAAKRLAKAEGKGLQLLVAAIES